MSEYDATSVESADPTDPAGPPRSSRSWAAPTSASRRWSTDHRSPRGRRGGPARCDPRPCLLRRQLERARLHRGRHRRLGPRRPWPRGADRGQAEVAVVAGRRGALRGRRDRRDHRRATRPCVRILRKSGKPVVLAANKVDDQAHRGGGVRPVEPRARASRTRSRRCTDAAPATCWTRSSRRCRRPRPRPSRRSAARGGSRSVGKPNVGKSSLLNMLAKEDRVVVDDRLRPRPSTRSTS